MLELDVSHRLGGLDLDVSLAVEHGCVALAGPSGAGKTTVLRAVAGLLRPARGTIRCDGRAWLDTARGVCLAPDRRDCGVVFQDYALFPHLSARDNVAFGLRGLSRAERRLGAEELLERFDLPARAGARPHELSGGERQRVALARALARRPRALLIDEPLAALDARTRTHAIGALSAALRAAGVPVLLVTHDFAEAALLADRVAVMESGRVLQEGPPAQLAGAPASAFVADFTGASVLLGIARPGPGGTTAVSLDGGGELLSTDPGVGQVAASVYPWEVALEEPPPGEVARTSAQNRLAARVATVTRVGNRVRVGLDAGQALAAEVTGPAAERLALTPGRRVIASFKATATRLSAR